MVGINGLLSRSLVCGSTTFGLGAESSRLLACLEVSDCDNDK